MAAFYFQGGSGNESVTIDNSQIIVEVMIYLEAGADTLSLLNLDPNRNETKDTWCNGYPRNLLVLDYGKNGGSK